MSAVFRCFLFCVAALIPASGAAAASLPGHVAAAFSGYVDDCQQEKQKPPKESDFVTRVDDLDGDGKPDFVFDIARGCESNRMLYCGDDGCKIAFYLSTEETALSAHSFHVKSWRQAKGERPSRIIATMSGASCGPAKPATCEKTIRFKDGAMVVE